MSPLELEISHQMRNVIGIDPAFILTVDADTVCAKPIFTDNDALIFLYTVTPDSLNRLVAQSADDSRIIGVVVKQNSQTSRALDGQ